MVGTHIPPNKPVVPMDISAFGTVQIPHAGKIFLLADSAGGKGDHPTFTPRTGNSCPYYYVMNWCKICETFHRLIAPRFEYLSSKFLMALIPVGCYRCLYPGNLYSTTELSQGFIEEWFMRDNALYMMDGAYDTGSRGTTPTRGNTEVR
jgi:hypothetical protein